VATTVSGQARILVFSIGDARPAPRILPVVNCLDLTLPSPAANLALDEALLDALENGQGGEVLRFWEPRDYWVVLGYSNRLDTEVNAAACRAHDVGIFRRCSGGGTVLQGPGCLNYSLILDMEKNAALQTINGANCFIMSRNRDTLSGLLGREVRIQGHTDLAVDGLKFSGNAQRRKRRALIFHGTFLLRFDLAAIEKFLPMPSREPDYRKGRSHTSFLTNIDVPAEAINTALQQAWSADGPLKTVPDCQHLVAAKYSQDDWNCKF
jgi:lipoate-protein ligase A